MLTNSGFHVTQHFKNKKPLLSFIYSGDYNLSICSKNKFACNFCVWSTYIKVHQNLADETCG
jgi:hypothetical protein